MKGLLIDVSVTVSLLVPSGSTLPGSIAVEGAKVGLLESWNACIDLAQTRLADAVNLGGIWCDVRSWRSEVW